MKKLLAGLMMVAMVGVSDLSAGSFGDSFGGAFLGSTVSNIVTRPREKTVVVHDGGSDRGLSSRERRSYEKIIDRLKKKIYDLEDEISRLRRRLRRRR